MSITISQQFRRIKSVSGQIWSDHLVVVVAGVAPQLLGDLLERAGDRAAGGHRAGTERGELELASPRCDHPSIKSDILARLL